MIAEVRNGRRRGPVLNGKRSARLIRASHEICPGTVARRGYGGYRLTDTVTVVFVEGVSGAATKLAGVGSSLNQEDAVAAANLARTAVRYDRDQLVIEEMEYGSRMEYRLVAVNSFARREWQPTRRKRQRQSSRRSMQEEKWPCRYGRYGRQLLRVERICENGSIALFGMLSIVRNCRKGSTTSKYHH